MCSSILLNVIPQLTAFLGTGLLGRWFDRTSPWKAWAVVRTGWGLDPLLLGATPMVAHLFPPALFLMPFLGRASRGSTMGGSWVLWWRLGVNHFAPPGGDTTRYMGILMFMNGVMRLVAPIVGGWLLYRMSQTGMLFIGGFGVLLSALHAFYEYRREQRDRRLATTADFERQFSNGGNTAAGWAGPPPSR